MGLIFSHAGVMLDTNSEQDVRDRAIAKLLCNHMKEFDKLVDEIGAEMLKVLIMEYECLK